MTEQTTGTAWGLLRERHFSPFRLYLDRENRIAFLLNPKVATQLSRRILVEAMRDFRGLDDPSAGRWRPLSFPRKFPVARLGDFAHFFGHPGDYAAFAVVRNPYARLVSAWRNKFLDPHAAGGRRAHYPRSIRGSLLTGLRRFARANRLGGAEENTLVPFATFLAWVEAQPEGQRNHHWDSQTDVLFHDRLPQTRAFPVEEGLAPAFAAILGPLGATGDWIAARTAERINASAGAAEPVLDEALADRVHRLCARDFAAYGYDRESWRDLAGVGRPGEPGQAAAAE